MWSESPYKTIILNPEELPLAVAMWAFGMLGA